VLEQDMATVRHLGYFPFCVERLDAVPVGDDGYTAYPVGVSLETAMRWYWVARVWRLQVSMSGVTSANVTFPNRATYDFGTERGVPASEKNLVCFRETFVETGAGDPSAGGFDQMGVNLFFGNGGYSPVILVDGQYYPYLEFYAYSQVEGIGTYDVGLGAGVSGGSVTIDGVPVPSFLFGSPASASATISITERWQFL
jgi:hypothetical protein